MSAPDLDPVRALISEFVSSVEEALDARWHAWDIDLAESEKHEVIAGLVSRQCTLATAIAESPGMWNAHVAPVLLRCMCDAYITLAWILEDPLVRSRRFIRHGLGLVKLEVAHHKGRIERGEAYPEEHGFVETMQGWFESQRRDELTEVNLGSMSGTNTRQMAHEAGCADFYQFVFTPFSAAVHSQWHHIARLNLETCANPLHRFHRVPRLSRLAPDPHYLHLGAKYLAKTLDLFDTKTAVTVTAASPLEVLEEALSRLSRGSEADEAVEPADEESP